jgi:hypothetical protein
MCCSKLIIGIVRLCGVLAVVALGDIRAAVGVEPAPPAAAEQTQPVEGVLLLREGGVLTGKISRAGDRYFVTGPSSEISLPAASVELVCHSLQAAYEHRRRTLRKPSANAHLALAEWCLRYNLYPQAAEQLIAARGLDARHPKLALLERRLNVVSQSLKDRSIHSPPARAELTATAAANTSQPFVGDVSAEAVERFARKVQPLLVNNCTMSGCHRPGGKQSFQLDRSLLHDMASPRSTRQNLTAALALVDRERPHESPLLKIGRTDHGGMDRPIFGPRQHQQFLQLVGWVNLVTNSEHGDSANPPSVVDTGIPVGRYAITDMETPAESPASNRVTPVAYFTEVAPLETSPAHATGPNQAPRRRRGAALEIWRPTDLFDPEIFNRQTALEKPREAR